MRAARAFFLALLLPATFTVLACTESATEPGITDEIVIGGLFSLTGNWSTLGTTSKAALELALEDANEVLRLGNSSMRFWPLVEDTELDPQIAKEAAARLRAAGAVVTLGPQSSAEVEALMGYAKANGLLVVSQSSTAGSLAVPNDNILRLTPGDSLEIVALSALMTDDGVEAVVPLWRADAGNQGLAHAMQAHLPTIGIEISAGVEYGTSQTDFTAVLAVIRGEVEEAIAAVGASRVAVALASFDEAVQIFQAARLDPVLSSVKWYGTDGVALSAALEDDAVAAAFAAHVGFVTPIFGLNDANERRWRPIVDRIQERTGLEPDAFAVAVYDGAMVAVQAFLSTGADVDAESLRTRFIQVADSYRGGTGPMKLNDDGDRSEGDFDFFALQPDGAGFRWVRVAHYDTRTSELVR